MVNLTKKDLEELGVNVASAIETVKKIESEHLERYPKGAKPSERAPLPEEKVRSIADKAVQPHAVAMVQSAVDSLTAILKGSIGSK